MNTFLLLLTMAAWVAIVQAVKEIYRINRYGYIKKEHFGVEQ
jgi:hypothetical protein